MARGFLRETINTLKGIGALSYISRERSRNIILAFTFVGAVMALAFALAVGGGGIARGQDSLTPTPTYTPLPTWATDPSPCALGTVVPNPSDNPELVGDCEALWAFRNGLGNASRHNINWSGDTPIEQWEGVTFYGKFTQTSTLPRVSKVELSRRTLLGSLPAEFGSLDLRFLDLSHNDFYGQIPEELGNMPTLISLDLSDNQLDGEIPEELGKLSAHLHTLRLNNNRLEGTIPEELGKLRILNVLRLNNNRLEGEIPIELGNLSSLVNLSLANNRLEGTIPEELGKLSNLGNLSLVNNQLEGAIPKELGNITRLKFLRLSGNELTGCVPPLLANVRDNDLVELGLPLCVCMESGALTNVSDNPGLVSDCEALMAFRDSTTSTKPLNWGAGTPIAQWEGVTIGSVMVENSTSTVSRATTLMLMGRGLSGSLPTELGNLSQLIALLLNDNDLSGGIPEELGNLSQLTALLLNENDLSGGIPEELGKLTQLSTLDLGSNSLSGEIPEELGKLTKLVHLYLNQNDLSGEIPEELSSLTKLEYLFLAGRGEFRGCIPPLLAGVWRNDMSELGLPLCACMEGGALTNVSDNPGLVSDCEALLAFRDSTTSTRPLNWGADTPIAQWEGVTVKSVMVENSTSTVPRATDLDLNGRGLKGSLPPELGNLAQLNVLQLDNNSLSGEIPEELGKLANLQLLFIGSNNLTGAIPTELGSLSQLRTLLLSGNDLDGQIPKELGNLSNLRGLYLHNNDLDGQIPKELGNLSYLQGLSLTGNSFSGCIPPLLANVEYNDLPELGLPFCGCDGGSIVPKPSDNPGLVSDCEGLLAFRDSVTATTTLNWGYSAPIAEWEGVTVESVMLGGSTSTVPRVTGLSLSQRGLSGSIPRELGTLTQLRTLDLSDNSLSDRIPATLGNITELRTLDLSGNDFSDKIFSNLGKLTQLRTLDLSDNHLIGRMSAELAGLKQLRTLDLSGNDLSILIVSEKWANLAQLRTLDLSDNSFGGQIPGELSYLTQLTTLKLSGNEFTGCIAPFLADIETNDLSEIGLPFCVLDARPVVEDVIAGDRQLTAYWTFDQDQTADLTGWKICRFDSEAPMVCHPSIGAAERSYILTGLVNGRSYGVIVTPLFYSSQIEGNSGMGIGTPSAEGATVPGAPRDVEVYRAIESSDERNIYGLAWNSPETDGGARVKGYQYRFGGGDWVTVTTAKDDWWSVKIAPASLDPLRSEDVKFEVRAANRLGEGEAGTYILPALPSPPVIDDVLRRPDDFTAIIQWSEVEGATKYRYNLRRMPNEADKAAGCIGGVSVEVCFPWSGWKDVTARSEIPSELTPGKAGVELTGRRHGRIHYFKVLAVTPQGNTAPSETVQFLMEAGDTTFSANDE